MAEADGAGSPEVAPETAQFAFWLGTWDLTWGDGQHGTNQITTILDGQVIQEQFDGAPAMPFQGLSVSVYNKARACWQQTWVDNTGGYLDFTGGWTGDCMVLGRTAERDGRRIRQRMVWYNITPDALDWNWERSTDEGATWEVLWAIHYARRR